jgi:hypothetical protein
MPTQGVGMSAFRQFLDHRSLSVLIALTLLFLGLETFYALHRSLGHDEFSGAWSLMELAGGVPYRDFQPYKPVLGYYLQLALLQLAPDTWTGYLIIRLGMTSLAVSVLLLGALWLRRLYRADAVCLAYALLIVMTSLVEYAIEVRLDMLTALFGFVSLLLLLDRRVALAGTLAGLSFLISQKGTMYAFAGGLGLLACLVCHRDPQPDGDEFGNRKSLPGSAGARLSGKSGWSWARDVLLYGACAALPVGLYVLCWSLLASLPLVIGPTFGQATQLHALNSPVHGVPYFQLIAWLVTVFRNPFFYICTLWSLGLLLSLGRARAPHETLLLVYGLTVACIMLKIRQPFWYMFVLLVPTAFVLHVCLFSRELGNPNSLLCRPLLWTCYVMLGLVLPLSRVGVVAQDDPGPQRQTLELAEALLQPGDRYFAGFQLLYRGNVHERSLGMVDTNTAYPVHSMTSAQHEAILERFREEPIRFIVWTSVIDDGVPDLIKKYLFRNYAPFWGNVWLYAPQCRPTDSDVILLFTGSYLIETETPGQVRIDGKSCSCGQTVVLECGRHSIDASVRFRLKLQQPSAERLLNPAYREPVWFFWPGKGPIDDFMRDGVWVKD